LRVYSELLLKKGIPHAFLSPGEKIVLAGGNEYEEGEIAFPHQIHSSTILSYKEWERGEKEGDGIYSTFQVPVGIRTADCLPILIATKREVMAIHAGWRGIARGILLKILEQISSENKEEVVIAIGPAIRGCCYEVDEPVFSALQIPRSKGKLDLPDYTALFFLDHSFPNVEILPICTFCTPPWASYRREKEKAGRNLAVIQNPTSPISKE
jgi:hypothetical protein